MTMRMPFDELEGKEGWLVQKPKIDFLPISPFSSTLAQYEDQRRNSTSRREGGTSALPVSSAIPPRPPRGLN